MILVTLGTQDKSFKRLLKAIEHQIEMGHITEPVVVQAGYTKYKSKEMEIFDLIPLDEFNQLISKCSFLITHGGVGSIISGLNNGKVVIAAARLKEYGEHDNNHQLQIIEELTNNGYILKLDDFNKLDEVLKQAQTFIPKKYKSNTDHMINIIEEYIDNN